MSTEKLLQKVFTQGQSFEEFATAAGSRGRSFLRRYREISVPGELADALRDRIEELGGLRVLVTAEAWCPDAAENVPAIARLMETAPGDVQLRLFVRSEHPELDSLLRGLDVTRLPGVLLCDEGFCVQGTWQERPAPAHRLVDSIKKGRESGEDTRELASRLQEGYRSGRFRRAAMEEILSAVGSDL